MEKSGLIRCGIVLGRWTGISNSARHVVCGDNAKQDQFKQYRKRGPAVDDSFDLDTDAPEYELEEPMSLQEMADLFCSATEAMPDSDKAEIRAQLERDLFGEAMENETSFQCANCGQPIRKMRFNSMPVWEHVPHPPGLIWPNTHCRAVDKHARPIWAQLLNDHDRVFLQQIGVGCD